MNIMSNNTSYEEPKKYKLLGKKSIAKPKQSVTSADNDFSLVDRSRKL